MLEKFYTSPDLPPVYLQVPQQTSLTLGEKNNYIIEIDNIDSMEELKELDRKICSDTSLTDDDKHFIGMIGKSRSDKLIKQRPKFTIQDSFISFPM